MCGWLKLTKWISRLAKGKKKSVKDGTVTLRNFPTLHFTSIYNCNNCIPNQEIGRGELKRVRNDEDEGSVKSFVEYIQNSHGTTVTTLRRTALA